jgi:carbon storage regulator
MFVLSRERDTSVIFGSDLILTVLEVQPTRVRFAVSPASLRGRRAVLGLRADDGLWLVRDEECSIGLGVKVSVVDIREDKVRVGINAPWEMPVHRKEVYDAIEEMRRRAGGWESDQ